MKKLLFISVILVEIISIVALIRLIFNKKNALGTYTVNPIKKESLVFSPSENLKYFYEPKPGTQIIEEAWLPEKAVYQINQDSLNTTKDYDIEKRQGVFRIIALGDSFTFGQNVSTQYNWTYLLEEILNKNKTCSNIKKFEVINLGVYAYDAEYAVERYKLRGVKYNPDLIIWTFSDFERILEKMMPLIKKYDDDQNRKLGKQGIFYDNWRRAREDLIKQIGFTGIISYQTDQINKLDKYYSGTLLYVALPSKEEYLNILKERVKNNKNLFFFKMSLDYQKNKDLVLPDDHLNKKGHIYFSQKILDYLINNKLVPCPQQENKK